MHHKIPYETGVRTTRGGKDARNAVMRALLSFQCIFEQSLGAKIFSLSFMHAGSGKQNTRDHSSISNFLSISSSLSYSSSFKLTSPKNVS